MNDQTAETTAIEVMPADTMARIEKATVDVQISTAHQYPRSMATFKRRALEMVTMDEETAQSCIYRRPVGKKPNGSVEYAEGKSVRMAEIVGASYGNLRVGSMLIEQTPRMVKARGFAHDLETNFAATSEVVESTVDRNGRPYSERMAVVVAKACLAKARRDATFMVVPGALCKGLEEQARLTAIGTEATLGKRRSLVQDWINKLGVPPARVWAALGIKGIDDVGIEQLETLTGLRTAIRDREITLDEAFPAPKLPTEGQEGAKDGLGERLKGGKGNGKGAGAKVAPAQPEPPASGEGDAAANAAAAAEAAADEQAAADLGL